MAHLNIPIHGVSELRPEFETVCAMLDHAVATAPDAVALRRMGLSLTYREEGRAVAALARHLATTAAPGEVVALLLPNSAEFHVAYFAAVKALAAPALLHPLYPALQLAPLLRDVAPRAVVCTPATRELVLGLARPLGNPEVICLGDEVTVAALMAEPDAPLGRRGATPKRSAH